MKSMSSLGRILGRSRLALGLLVALLGGAVRPGGADDERLRRPGADPPRARCPPTGWRARLKQAGEGVYRRLGPGRVRAPRAGSGARAPRPAGAAPRRGALPRPAGRCPGAARGLSRHGAVEGRPPGPRAGPAAPGRDGDRRMNFAVRKPRFDNRDAILTRFEDPKRGKNGDRPRPAGRPAGRTHADHGLVGPGRDPARGAGRGSARAGEPGGVAGTGVARGPQSWTRPPAARRGFGRAEADRLGAAPGRGRATGASGALPAAGGRSCRCCCAAPARGRARRSSWPGRKTVQKLSPDGLESATTFSLEGLHQGVRDLACRPRPLPPARRR